MTSAAARFFDHDLHDLVLHAAMDTRAVERCDAHARAWIDAGDAALWGRARERAAAEASSLGLRCGPAEIEAALEGVRRRSVDECPHCEEQARLRL